MEKTIDKIPIKITLPTLFTILLATFAVTSMFFKLQQDITVANMGIANILKEISQNKKTIDELTVKAEDHEKRIIRLEM